MKAQILKSVISNGKSIVLLKNNFNNCHVAIWDNTDINSYNNSICLPVNFNMTCGYGSNEKNTYLLEKFNKIVSNSNIENWKNIKS